MRLQNLAHYLSSRFCYFFFIKFYINENLSCLPIYISSIHRLFNHTYNFVGIAFVVEPRCVSACLCGTSKSQKCKNKFAKITLELVVYGDDMMVLVKQIQRHLKWRTCSKTYSLSLVSTVVEFTSHFISISFPLIAITN